MKHEIPRRRNKHCYHQKVISCSCSDIGLRQGTLEDDPGVSLDFRVPETSVSQTGVEMEKVNVRRPVTFSVNVTDSNLKK